MKNNNLNIVTNMSLREKILKTFIVTIREINAHGGPEKFFEEYPVGGMYYSEGKLLLDEKGKEIGTATTPQRLAECRKHSKGRLLVCADGAAMDGQKVRINPQRSLGSTKNTDDAYNMGKIYGMQMNSKHIDWILQPSIDMCLDHLMYLTTISNDPELTAKLYRQVVRGIQNQGVCATVKHFPGLGTHFVNMHIAPGSNTMLFDEWMDTYGYIYKEMFKEDVMSVMTTHVSLKSYDRTGDNGYYPIATFSKKLTTDLLKGELGFKGAVVTDALIMGGMATGDLVAETVQAFKAGADLLLWPPVEAAEQIEKLILSGEIPMRRLDDALNHIDRMTKFREKAHMSQCMDKPDIDFADTTALDITRRGICLLRNDKNLIPINKESRKNVLIIDATDEDTASSRMLADELNLRGFDAYVKRDIYDVPSRVCWQSDIDHIQESADLVILNLNAHFVAQWSVAHMLIWASHLFDKSKKIIVNYGSPFFASDYFPEDPTIIEMNCTPNKDTIKLLVDALTGKSDFFGSCILKN